MASSSSNNVGSVSLEVDDENAQDESNSFIPRGIVRQKLTKLKEQLRDLDSRSTPTVAKLKLVPETSREEFDLSESILNAISAAIQPNMTQSMCATRSLELQNVLRQQLCAPVNDTFHQHADTIDDLRSQLLAETHLREKTEEHQLRLEQELELLRDRSGYGTDDDTASSLNENSESQRRGFSFTRLFSRGYNDNDLYYRRQLHVVRAERDSLRRDLFNLEQIYCSMVESRSRLFFQKELLTLELENLTRDLFEEANRMVATEARMRAELQSSNQLLSNKLANLMTGLQQDLSHHLDRVSPAGRIALREKALLKISRSPPLSPHTVTSASLSVSSPIIPVVTRRNSMPPTETQRELVSATKRSL